jgi:hypothetical protein
MSVTKKRLYNEYIKFGFTITEKMGFTSLSAVMQFSAMMT